jgi:chromosome partitioning protein
VLLSKHRRQRVPKHAEAIARDAALSRVLAIVNDKGGVGKTSIAANLAGQFAAADYRALLVDLNRQANLADDLGFRGTGLDDQGKSLVQSLQFGQTPVPARDVRPNLDIICGGTALEDLTALMISRVSNRGRQAYRILGDILAPIAEDYDMVIVDCPPESTILTDLALAAARWVLMPTKSDAGGLVGMTLVGERFKLAREINPSLGLLGAVLFATGTKSSAIHSEVRTAVEKAFGGSSPLFTAKIRHAERTAQDARRLGKLAHELEAELERQPAWWEVLRTGEGTRPRLSATAASVAGDYRDLAVEVLTVLRAAEEAAEQEVGIR